MARPAVATIDLSAILDNYKYIRELAPNSNALAIVKANAYGHGAVPVAKKLESSTDGFGVACIEEALELRDAGIEKPILLLEGFFDSTELEIISEQNLWTAVHSEEQVTQLETSKLIRPINVWLKVDIGMHRLGISPDRYVEIRERLTALPHVSKVITMGHFSSADTPDIKTTHQQLKVINNITSGLDVDLSLANSAGCLAHKQAKAAWQRPGLMLYGASPFTTDQPLARKLKPAMSLTSQVIALRDINAGESVGYSATWTAKRRSKIATIAMGYGDGYPRHAENGTPVRIGQNRARLVGRVSMDMLAVDVTDLPAVTVGTEVELWGKNLLAAEVASSADTIPYTLFTGVTNRVHKRYIES